jgi:hypothetical protein
MAAEGKKKISVDDEVKQIIEWDKAGIELLFDTRPGKFKELTGEEIKQLGSRTRTAYAISKDMAKDRLEEEPLAAAIGSVEVKTPRTLEKAEGGFKVNREAGSSIKRLEIKAVSDGVKRDDLYYARAEDVEDEEAMGATIVTSGVKSHANPSGQGVHRVTRKGVDELILMRRSNRNAAIAQESNRVHGAISEGIDSSLRAEGDRIPGATKGRSFKDNDADFVPIGN